MITLMQLVTVARDLRSEEGENVEYDRALVELIANVLDGEHDFVRSVAVDLVLDGKEPVSVAPFHAGNLVAVTDTRSGLITAGEALDEIKRTLLGEALNHADFVRRVTRILESAGLIQRKAGS